MQMNIVKSLLPLLLFAAPMSQASECVVLLHGLARTANSMLVLEENLSAAGYSVLNIGYPSRKKPIEELSEIAVGDGLEGCAAVGASPVNFVTHSLGGILVRYYFNQHSDKSPGRVVMLGPPNKGSEVVDSFKNLPGFELLNGPAGRQLGTDAADIPKQLGPVDFELGIIAGTQSVNLIMSAILPSTDDGKVSLESAKVEGMSDYVAMPVTHPFMMRNDDVIDQVLNFLQHGYFEHE